MAHSVKGCQSSVPSRLFQHIPIKVSQDACHARCLMVIPGNKTLPFTVVSLGYPYASDCVGPMRNMSIADSASRERHMQFP